MDEKTSKIKINLQVVLPVLYGTFLLFSYGSLYIACTGLTKCEFFLPTYYKLGTFRGYDRIFLSSLVFYSLLLGITYTGAYLKLTKDQKQLTLLRTFGLISAFSLPVLALTNDENSYHSLHFDLIRSGSFYSFVLSTAAWNIVVFNNIKLLSGLFNKLQQIFYQVFRLVFGGFFAVLTIRVLQKLNEDSFSPHHHPVADWLLITLGTLLNSLVIQFFRNFTISIKSKVLS